jgi:uncharacterized glyoxalase superfamily protein PhnB
VRDMDAMIAFYRALGVGIADAPPPWDTNHRTADVGAGLDFDLDSSAFAHQWDVGWPAGRTGVVLGFKVVTRDSVDALYADLVAAGHRGQQPPYDAFWGARYAVVTDPDGNAVGLMSPVDPARRTPPPTPPPT